MNFNILMHRTNIFAICGSQTWEIFVARFMILTLFFSLSAHATSSNCTYTSNEALESLSEPNGTSALDCALKLAQKYMTKYKDQIQETLFITELRYGSSFGWNYNPLNEGAIYTFAAVDSKNTKTFSGYLAVNIKQNGKRFSCYSVEARTTSKDVIVFVQNSEGKAIWSRNGAEKECSLF